VVKLMLQVLLQHHLHLAAGKLLVDEGDNLAAMAVLPRAAPQLPGQGGGGAVVLEGPSSQKQHGYSARLRVGRLLSLYRAKVLRLFMPITPITASGSSPLATRLWVRPRRSPCRVSPSSSPAKSR
jgi:hypothetical protein